MKSLSRVVREQSHGRNKIPFYALCKSSISNRAKVIDKAAEVLCEEDLKRNRTTKDVKKMLSFKNFLELC